MIEKPDTRPFPRDARLRARIERLRAWQRLMDEAFRVPGTRLRFGWDPIIGMIPWAGDVVGAIMGLVLLFHGHRMRLPGVVQARMVLNVIIDLALGAVPVLGDVVDLFWKSTTRNLVLLEHYAEAERPASWRDWAFVLSAVVLVAAVAAMPLVLLASLVGLLAGPR